MSATHAFQALGLPDASVSVLTELGYTQPTPVQGESIPILLEGRDIIAKAQTGTGKTAAFALPLLANLDIRLRQPQVLVIAPTRELAGQVAEAFKSYGKYLKGFNIATIYGGQDYRSQMQSLRGGSHVVVGTPGRVMDHLRRGSLRLDNLQAIVLDEADEMLNMGFIEDIEWILQQIPHEHQTALFSATMPEPIVKIAKKYLTDPARVSIKSTESTIAKIEQCYTCVAKPDKLDALIRFIEFEDIQASIIFTATKQFSTEIAEKLQTLGYTAAALNGDMSQSAREKVITKIKNGALNIIVATDVAARGIDVERISHVINYDLPYDAETYTHRIGRTGRAGRTGKAFSLINPRENRSFQNIARNINATITLIEPASVKAVKQKRKQALHEKLADVLLKHTKLDYFRQGIADIVEETDASVEDIAAALLYLNQEKDGTRLHEIKLAKPEAGGNRRSRPSRSRSDRRPSRSRSEDRSSRSRSDRSSRSRSDDRSSRSRSDDRSSRSRSDDRPSRSRSDDRSSRSRSDDRPSRSRSDDRSSSRSRSDDRPSRSRSDRKQGKFKKSA